MQAIYATLEDGKGLEEQYLLGNIGHLNETSIEGTDLPEGVTEADYLRALKRDVLGLVRKLTTACCISGNRQEEFKDTVLEGNQNQMWTDDHGESVSVKPLQLLRDCEIRWSSTHFMVDWILTMLPVCVPSTLTSSHPSFSRLSNPLLVIQIYLMPAL